MINAIARAPVMVALLVGTALAQSAAPPPGAKPDAPPASSTGNKRENCRLQAASFRGPERADMLQLCIEEARLACLKQAIAEKVRGPARREYLKSCIGS